MIISVSRRTDVPAFYSRWFFHRLQEGFVIACNPINAHQVKRVSLSPEAVDGFVFWTRNAAPMLRELHRLRDYGFYFQFTLTPYGADLEPRLPPMEERIDHFLRLSDRVGAQRVIWRYDPILLSKNVGLDDHLDRFEKIARRLSGYTHKCIISFIDMYRHIQKRVTDLSVAAPGILDMRKLAASIAEMARKAGMKVETCAEGIDLADLGIEHGRCIDARLISEITGKTLNVEKDRRQRKLCGCAASVDIGQYNTCRYLCQYCYANISRKKIEENDAMHEEKSPSLVGRIGGK
jgi:DNA repair photolyase